MLKIVSILSFAISKIEICIDMINKIIPPSDVKNKEKAAHQRNTLNVASIFFSLSSPRISGAARKNARKSNIKPTRVKITAV